MYRKTPPNISQSAKGLFKLKHFFFFSNPCLLFQRTLAAPVVTLQLILLRVTAQEPPALALCRGILAKIGTKCCFTEHWCISETQNDSNPSVLSSTWAQAFAFLVKHLIWNISVFFITQHTPLLHIHNRRIWDLELQQLFFFLSFFFL